MKAIHQRQEHTSSYYAATVNEHITYPELDGPIETDICVVGGGFCGVSTALTLAERGFRVALVEANRVGWGASGRNGGQLIHGISGLSKISKTHGKDKARMFWDMSWRGNDIIHERVARYDIACDLKQGFVETALKKHQVNDLQEYAEEMERFDAPFKWEVWDRQQTRDFLGTDAYLGGFVNFRDGHLHPLNLCIGEAKAAAKLGVQIFEMSPVTGIDHGERAVVKTDKGSIAADSVILAGGAYSLFEQKHLSNLVFPAGSYIIGTEPLAEDVVARINPRDIAVCDLNEVVDYYRLSADKRLLYGGRCNYSGREPSDIKAAILPRMLKIYPELKGVRIDFEWGGNIGIVLNRVPSVGRIKGNVYYCQGFSGHGVNATHILGEIMADAVGGTMEKFDMFANYPHFRLPGSQWIGNQIIALGMLYYRMKDLL